MQPYGHGPSPMTNRLVAKELMQMQSLSLKPLSLALHSSYNNTKAIDAANGIHMMREGLEERKDMGMGIGASSSSSGDNILRTKSAGNPLNNISGV